MLRRTLPLLALVGLLVACSEDDGSTGPQEERFEANLSGATEVPQKTTTGTGTATFTVSGSTIQFQLQAANLTNVTAAHIHAPAPSGENAGVVVPLFAADPAQTLGATPVTLASGTIPSAQFTINPNTGISADSLIALFRNGQAYVNVHTTANPAGEIRGQIQAAPVTAGQ